MHAQYYFLHCMDAVRGCAGSCARALHACARRLSERPELRATAKVVGVLEPGRRRGQVVGVLKEEPGGGPLFLVPCDPRLPRAVVRGAELPPQLRSALQARALAAPMCGW